MIWKKKIQETLVSSGLNQKQLGEQLGVTSVTISNWVRGNGQPHTVAKGEILEKISQLTPATKQPKAKATKVVKPSSEDKIISHLKVENEQLKERLYQLEIQKADSSDYLVDKLLDRLGGIAQSELEIRIRELEFKLQEMNAKPTRSSERLENLEMKLSSITVDEIKVQGEKMLADIVILADSVKDIDRKRSGIEDKIELLEERISQLNKNLEKA